MNQQKYRHWCHTLFLVVISLTITGCSDNSAPDRVYEVSVSNLTVSQPLSPIAVIAHSDSYQIFNIGEAASVGLENLAEGGSNSELISEAQSQSAVVATTAGSSAVAPGTSDTVTININRDDSVGVQLSVVTMLVNTNDAMTAARALDISGLAIDDSIEVETISYDSGTEANSEATGTIPGPADSGEGFSAARDDIANQVTAHAGVITADDGLTESVLNHQHRWDNPVARVRVTRLR